MPKVSVIVPVYNAESYLKFAIESILNQTFSDFEILCVDDGSSDGSLEILNQLAKEDERIRVFSQTNKSAGAARNLGLSVAKGEYLAFLDADDFFEPSFLETMYGKAIKHNADIVICSANSYNNKDGALVFMPYSLDSFAYPKNLPVFSYKDMPKYIFNFSQNWNWNKIFKRSFIEKNNIKFQELFRTNDLLFTCKALVLADRICAVNEPLVNYRIGQKTNSQSTNHLYPFDFYKAFFALKKFLVEMGLYDGDIKQSFVNWAMGGIVHNLSVQKNKKVKAKLKRFLFPKCFEELDLKCMKEIYAYDLCLMERFFILSGKIKINPLKKMAHSVFSIKNSNNYKHKVITVFGIKFSLKCLAGPRVSVIIPVYNAEKYLSECLNSLLVQTLGDIEIICVDDGSTDRSFEILSKYAMKHRNIVVLQQENKGAAAARNLGMSVARGKYIGFVDSDDYASPNYYNELYKNTFFGLADISATTNVALLGNKGKTTQKYTGLRKNILFKKEHKAKVIIATGISSNKIYRTDFLRKKQLRCLEFNCSAEDNYFTDVAVIESNFISVTDKAKYYYRQHSESITKIKKGRQEFLVFEVYRKVREYILSMDIQDDIKLFWLKTLKKRMMNDFRVFIDLLEDNLKDEFVEIANNEEKSLVDVCLSLDEGFDICAEGLLACPLSIILPVYNVEPFLDRCMKSILSQTFKDFELICVYGDSTDNSLKILKEYEKRDSRIKIIFQDGVGLANARNAALKIAKGKYIGFVDSDDWIEKETYQEAISFMTDDIDLVCWGANVVNEGLEEFSPCVTSAKNHQIVSLFGKINISKNSIENTPVTVWNKLFRASIIKDNNILFPEGMLFEDNDFTSIYSMHSRALFSLGKHFYNYVQRPGSLMSDIRTYKCDKTFQQLLIFDHIYRHFEERNLLKKNSEVLTSLYSSCLCGAYKFAPNDKKEDVRNLAYQLSKNYDVRVIKSKALKRLKRKEFHKIRELNHVVISLTSYPARINTVSKTIKSLMIQSFRADKIVLVLSEEEFPNKESALPKDLLDLRFEGLDILWFKENIRSYKKLIPTLKEYSNSIIITADDDVIYDWFWLERLYKAYAKKPNMVHCHRAHRIVFDKRQKIMPYSSWVWLISNVKPSYNNFFTGAGGVLYPVGALHSDVFKKDLFMSLAPNADDVWFFAMCLLGGKRINVVKNNIPDIVTIDGTQENCLWRSNVSECRNDMQINNVLEFYPELLNILDKRKYKYPEISILARLFSVRNTKAKNNKIYKVIRLFGFKFSVRNKRKEKIIKAQEAVNARFLALANEQRELKERIMALENNIAILK